MAASTTAAALCFNHITISNNVWKKLTFKWFRCWVECWFVWVCVFSHLMQNMKMKMITSEYSFLAKYIDLTDNSDLGYFSQHSISNVPLYLLKTYCQVGGQEGTKVQLFWSPVDASTISDLVGNLHRTIL